MEPKTYTNTEHIAFPMGGMGAGMLCLNGNASLGGFSLFHRPDLWSEPQIYAAVSCAGAGRRQAALLEGPVPSWKVFSRPGGGKGLPGKHYGLPRFAACGFSARFPFGTVALADEAARARYEGLYAMAREYFETTLYNGEYFCQRVIVQRAGHGLQCVLQRVYRR